MRRARVVLEHEAAQELGLSGVAGAVQRMAVVADHLALPYVRDLDEDVVTAARVGDDVLVVAPAGEHLLAVGDALDGLQLVAIPRGVLEI